MVQAIGQLEFSRHNNQQSIQCFQIEHRSRSDPNPQNPPKSFIQWFHILCIIYVHKSPSKQWFTTRGKGLYDGHGSFWAFLRQTLNRAITWQAIAGKLRRVRGVAVERSMVNDLLSKPGKPGCTEHYVPS